MRIFNSMLMAVLFLSAAGCAGNTKKTDRQNDNLKGDVKSVIQTDYEAVGKFGKTEKGMEQSKIRTVYDLEGNATEIEVSMYGEPVYSIIFEKDDDGRRIGGRKFGSDRLLEQIFSINYDDSGNPVEQAFFDPDGTMASKTLLKYDKNGYVVEQSDYDRNGELEYMQIYVNDSKGNRVEQKQYNPDGTLDQRHVFVYDKNGNLAEVKSYDSDGELFDFYTFSTDKNGNRSGMSFQLDGEVYSYRYEYELDENGNYIRSVEYDKESNLPETVTERAIEYF